MMAGGAQSRSATSLRAQTAAISALAAMVWGACSAPVLVSGAWAAPADTTAAEQRVTQATPGRSMGEPPPTRSSILTFVFGLDRMHDDNILQLTPHGFDRFALNPDPPRFLIASPDADINVMRADVRWRTRPLRRRESRLAASVDAYSYQRNDIKDWQQYEVSMRQELTASRRHLATLDLSWEELPSYYLGQITDADESFAAGTRIRHSLTYAQRTLAARVEQGWLGGRIVVGAGFERLRRDYNHSFDERDNHNDQWRITAEAEPFRRWGLSGRVTYLVGSLEARGDLPSSPIRDTDISYDHRGLGASVTVPWGREATRGRLEAGVMPERRAYTTADKFDLSRYGRINRRLEVSFKLYQRVWGPLEAVAVFSRLTSHARFTQGIDFDADVTDFEQTRTGLMLRTRWELPHR